MKTLQSHVDIEHGFPSQHPWSVYAHLAWALTLKETVATQQQEVPVTTVQNGRIAPFTGIESIVGPTLTLVHRNIHVSKNTTVSNLSNKSQTPCLHQKMPLSSALTSITSDTKRGSSTALLMRL